MRYSVYAKVDTNLIQVGKTLYMADAEKMLENWFSGYVVDNSGTIVIQKRYPVEPPNKCPTCSGPTRETTNLVCLTCGRDYATTERR